MVISKSGLNTLEYAERLIRAGVPEEQAKAQALALYEIINSSLATKRDIKELEREIKSMGYRLTTRVAIMYSGSIGITLGAILTMAKLGWLSIQ